MNLEEFRKYGEDMVEYVAHYLDSISHKSVTTNVCQGYLKTLLPENAPNTGESLEKIMEDFEKYIMPGLNHWQHPKFLAFFPAISSYPGILAEMISDSFDCVGFNWNISPCGNELETVVLDWYGKIIGLPDSFLYYPEGSSGGGMTQPTISEGILTCMITARQNIIKSVSQTRFSLSKPIVVASLVAYCSKEGHTSVQKAAALSLVKLKVLDTDKDLRLRGETLANAIKEDKEIGLIPFFVNITIGTATGACDPIDEIGIICEEHRIWLNVDSNYAGNALVCSEYKHYLKGIEHATSFNINPAKWLMVHLDCSVLFAKDIRKVSEYVLENKTLFSYGASDEHWSHQSNHVFRAFKFWIMMRSYGIDGLQKHIRNHVQLAKFFEKCVNEDERFETLTCHFGVVCFRLKGSNRINRALLKAINTSGNLFLSSYTLEGKYVMRFVLCSERVCEDDIISSWTVIKELADEVLETDKNNEEVNGSEECKDWWDFTLP